MAIVFDDIERDIAGPAQAGESHFGYLNRSSRDEAARVRNLVEEWIARYPEQHHAGLVARLRSPIDDAHTSAFFELALHELLLQTGHTIDEIEPTLEHTNRSPDFLVGDVAGNRFYLEAVTAVGKSAAEIASLARLNGAIRAVNQAHAPAHFLDSQTEGRPEKPVSLNKLRGQLNGWIAALPETEAANKSPPFEYCEHGMKITVSAFLRKKRLAEPGRAVGVQSMEPYWGTPGDGIRESVEKKSSRYGDLGLPYVVAVNSLAQHQGEEDAIDALFGSPCVVIRRYEDGRTEHEDSRNRDGVWWGQRGARKQGLSAVLSTERLDPWSLGQRRARLIRNPWATAPFPEASLKVDELNPVEGRLVKTGGQSFSEIFDLPPGWPEID